MRATYTSRISNGGAQSLMADGRRDLADSSQSCSNVAIVMTGRRTSRWHSGVQKLWTNYNN